MDPTGFAALTKAEQLNIEKELVKIYKKDFEQKLTSPSSSSAAATTTTARITTRTTTTSVNQQSTANINKAWQEFLTSIDKDMRQDSSAATATIQECLKRYRNLATK